MPRVGDVFQLLSGTLAVPNTTIQSAPYNAQQQDWVLEANTPRPISAGGTGSTTAAGARTSLGTMGAGDLAASPTKSLVVNTDSVVIIDSEAANVTKRWLVSDIRLAFGPASHDHTKLVSTVSDISLNLGGTPGAGTFAFNNKADGTGSNILLVTETGTFLTGNIAVTGAVTATAALSTTGTITGGTTVGVRGSGNVHFWFYGPLNEDRGVIYTTGGSAGPITVRTSGGDVFSFENTGTFRSPGPIASGGTIASGGAITSGGTITSGAGFIATSGNFNTATGTLILSTSSASGEIWFRPSNGTTTNDGYYSSAGNLVIAGTGFKPGGGSWTATSDARIKTVAGDYEASLDQILALQPVRFTYKGNAAGPDAQPPTPTDKEYIGLVAQAAEIPMPEMVQQIEGYIDGVAVNDLRLLDNSPLVYALVNSTKELVTRIDKLHERIKALEGASA
jgi:hypothetical protein